MRSVKELWSKSFGVFVFFLTRIKQAKAAAAWWWWPPKKTLLLGVMQIRPETSKFLCLCCMIPFFCSALAKRSKAHARKLLIYFFSFPSPFFSSFNSKYLKIPFTANQTSSFIFYTKQNSNLSLVIYNSLWEELILRLLHTTKWIIANSRDNSNKLQNVNEFRVQC